MSRCQCPDAMTPPPGSVTLHRPDDTHQREPVYRGHGAHVDVPDHRLPPSAAEMSRARRGAHPRAPEVTRRRRLGAH